MNRHVRVLVIGGGPAGLTAAMSVAQSTEVLVLEREHDAGGVPRHCDHTGFGLRDMYRSLTGPTYAGRLVDRARAAGVEIWTNATVTDWAGERAVNATTPQGRFTISADAIILATGARERPRSARRIPGDRPAGVYTTGQLQQTVHLQHQSVGTRAVVVGSELVSWSAVLTLREAGCSTVMMTTEYPKPEVYRALSMIGRALFRPTLRTNTRVVRVVGKSRVTAVEIEDMRTGHRSTIACDTVVFTGDWIPDHELARLRDLDIDAATLGPRVDAGLRTSVPGIFAAGNLLHPVDTGDAAALDGRHVALTVLDFLNGTSADRGGVELRPASSLLWVAPSVYRHDQATAPRGRLLAWSTVFRMFPVVELHQRGQVIARHRSIWPAAPGRVFRIPWSLLQKAQMSDGPVDVSIR